MTLSEARNSFFVANLDLKHLDGQQVAFERCLEFLDGLETTKSFNRRHSSYGLKHIVEDPSGRFGIPSSSGTYACYIYEGTFILAALAKGFRMKQGRGLSAVFNISEKSLKRRAKEIAADRSCRPLGEAA